MSDYVECATAYDKASEETGFDNESEKLKKAQNLLSPAAGYFSIALRVLGLAEIKARCPYAKTTTSIPTLVLW